MPATINRLRLPSPRLALAVAVLLLVAQSALFAVDVKVAFDKTFDFKSVSTWAWSEGYGQVLLARTKDDDPDAWRKAAEPIILDAVKSNMTQHGFTAAEGAPQVTITYYLALTTNMESQQIGQFLPPTMEWGIPPFQGVTQSLKILNRGSLVLDLSANKNVIWRGMAQAELKPDASIERREKLLRESVRDLIRRIPRK